LNFFQTASQSKRAGFLLDIFKNLAKIGEIDFPFCDLILIKKLFIFFGKKWLDKNSKMAARSKDGIGLIFSEQ
jgi:hypothetical protein